MGALRRPIIRTRHLPAPRKCGPAACEALISWGVLHRRALGGRDLNLRDRFEVFAGRDGCVGVTGRDIYVLPLVPRSAVRECQGQGEVAFVTGAAFRRHQDLGAYNIFGVNSGAECWWLA